MRLTLIDLRSISYLKSNTTGRDHPGCATFISLAFCINSILDFYPDKGYGARRARMTGKAEKCRLDLGFCQAKS